MRYGQAQRRKLLERKRELRNQWWLNLMYYVELDINEIFTRYHPILDRLYPTSTSG
jgi:hypothetical protein